MTQLENFKIVIIADDSGSMNTKISPHHGYNNDGPEKLIHDGMN